MLCKYCGSKGVHEFCLGKSKHFICDDCEPLPPSKRQKTLSELSESNESNLNDQHDINNNIPMAAPKYIGTSYLKSLKLLQSMKHFRIVKLKFKLPHSTDTNAINSIQKTAKKRKRNAEI